MAIRANRASGLIALIALAGSAQTIESPAFDAASVKPAPRDRQTGGNRTTRNGINFEGSTLRYCIGFAYGVPDFQIDGPAWIDDLRYDIVAKTAQAGGAKLWAQMLRTLLAERFELRVHREQREFRGFALTVAGPLKMTKAAPQPEPAPGMPPRQPILRQMREVNGNIRLTGEHATMTTLANALRLALGAPVEDRTGTADAYDFEVEISAEDSRNGSMFRSDGEPAPRVDGGASVFASLRSLGLKLQSQKVPLDVIVVDSARKTPTEN